MALEWRGKHSEVRKQFREYDEICLYGGSGSAKTWLILETIVARALIYPKSRHLCLRVAFEYVKNSLWPALGEMMEAAWPGLWPSLRKNKSSGCWTVGFENGSEIWFGGSGEGEKTDKWLSTEFSTLYFNEASQNRSYGDIEQLKTRLRQRAFHSETKKRVRYKTFVDFNPPRRPSWQYTRYVEEVPSGVLVQKLGPRDNAHNLSPQYLDMLQKLSPRRRQRFWDGDFTQDLEGALWKFDVIEQAKISGAKVTEVGRCVVAVDPATSSNPGTDECGIIVVGQVEPKHTHVLADYTTPATASPKTWAAQAVRAYHEHECEAIVAEVNQGGDLVKEVIHNADPNVPVRTVHAAKGKFARAEPVYQLYEDGTVTHAPGLDQLEDEQLTWIPRDTTSSPNRVDACVWGVWDLRLKGAEPMFLMA